MKTAEKADANFESLLNYLRQSRAFDFTGYKRPSLMRRVGKRMQMVTVGNFSDYIDYLEVHPDEFTHLFNTILINVTSFFRDPPAWNYWAREIIPRVMQQKQGDEPIRIWSAGCATGEEAYTIAIVLAEALGIEAFKRRVKVYATDVDEEALTVARQASFNAKELEPVSDKLREKYFETVAGRRVFRADLRRSIIFGRNDLVQDAPISRLDLLVCRNTLMYFNAETQGHILARFHYALNGNGFLFLGRAEMLLTHTNVFTPLELKYRIFTKVPDVNMRDRFLVPHQTVNNDAGSQTAKKLRLNEIAFDAAPVARIVVDFNGILALASQKARILFGLASKDIGRPLQDLELSYRPVELRSVIEQAYAEHRTVTLANVERRLPEGEIQFYDVIVVPFYDNGSAIGISISFADVTHHHKLNEDLQHSKEELATAFEELQSTHEELETTNEELQSTNEELETTNEELHSSNEELETMNEEMQSTNEELQTSNDQLRQRTDELNNANAFLQSVLAGLHAGAVVVNQNLTVLVWNQRAEDLWGLRADEVKGQSLLNLDIGLPVGQVKGIIRPCFSGEADYREVVLDATNRRGKAIKCRVTCTPLDLRHESPLKTQSKERHGIILLMEEWEQ